jgi:hypothetical protein
MQRNNQKKDKLFKIVYSLRIMEQLVEMGYRPVERMESPVIEGFYCWLFERNEEFDRDFSALVEERSTLKKRGASNG